MLPLASRYNGSDFEGPRGPKGPVGPGWVGGGDSDLHVASRLEPPGTRMFHAWLREVRVDGNNLQG